ncbi:KH homology domain-containing protein 1B-like isoform X2 [Arvicanthis niloticus]|uniref:KH homology domain-containing protein 1B-like isoform X2 n=1 Tax=Arvicanthis niloticus TaxID=61156 RepID=UPI001486C424|nr:KH homology domain-containing protein 1B-like [Arvicanthis niloticus]
MSGPRRDAWWNVPDNFHYPLMFYMEEDQEDYIFGPEDEYLRTLEVHSSTLIQLERWFTSSGQTRVTVVGPLKARLWVMDMIRKVGSQDTFDQAKGNVMLQRIRSHPLTQQDLEFQLEAGSSLWFTRMSSVEVPPSLRFPLTVVSWFWGSLQILCIHNFADLLW